MGRHADALRISLIWIDQFGRTGGRFHLHLVRPVTNGTITLPTCQGLTSVPFVTQRVIWPGMASGRCEVVFSELSKLLNQEYALGAPCLHGDFCSPQARPRGVQVCCGQAWSVAFDVTLTFATPKSSRRGADAIRVVGGRCTGGARRCKAVVAGRR